MQVLGRNYLSVIIPAFNEEATLNVLVERVCSIPGLLEVIIVDDCSTDASPKIIAELSRAYPMIRSIRMERNSGKTAALKKGFSLAQGHIVIVQDADLEYDPQEIPSVLAPIVEGKADVVYGSRFLVRKATRVVYFYHYVGNKLLTLFSNCLTNLNMTDVETCYKAFRRDIIRNMVITSSGFGFEIEVTAKIAKLKCRVYEVPISYYGRTYEEGKKITAADGVAALWYIVRYNLLCSKKASYSEIPSLQPIQAATEPMKAEAARRG